MIELSVVFIFFSSRRRHTRCSRDWSSDVCSSDLGGGAGMGCEATLHSREAASYFRPMGFWRRLFGGSGADEINPQRLDYLNEALALERQAITTRPSHHIAWRCATIPTTRAFSRTWRSRSPRRA